jgi:hypothetical protein
MTPAAAITEAVRRIRERQEARGAIIERAPSTATTQATSAQRPQIHGGFEPAQLSPEDINRFEAVQAAAARRAADTQPSVWLAKIAQAIVAGARGDADAARERARLYAAVLTDAVDAELARDVARDARRAGL